MRNLSLVVVHRHGPYPETICSSAIDLEISALYVANELIEGDETEVSVRKMMLDDHDDLRNPVNDQHATTAIGGKVIDFVPTYRFVNSKSDKTSVVSFHVCSETHTLVLITRTGDIAVLPLDQNEANFEVEGTVANGIRAASWSPDDALFALVTDDGNLTLMTSTFDVVSESQLHREDFGQGAPINLGWGTKETQFHGSLGKASAVAAPPVVIGSSPDDDSVPRISWRGDGHFFAVSSVDGTCRKIRIYSRTGDFQYTSEATPGLEHPLAWRPSGGLLVSTQRFGGFVGAGVGKEGRHDVIFFEKNGLRRGEFSLPPFGIETSKNPGTVRRWGYQVREVAWNCDSDVLAIWLEFDGGDVVQLWTSGNYHWYLKQEISIPGSTSEKPSRFTSLMWHPERSLHLILTTASEVIQRTYVWDTYVSHRNPPNDSGCVAVVDGSNVLLTPFRTQNIPPPMSSHRLSLAQSTPLSLNPPSNMPIHAAFSASADVLAILWEAGVVELWDLHIRPGSGHGQVMRPKSLQASIVSQDGGCRQVVMLPGLQIVVLSTTKHRNDAVCLSETNGSGPIRHIDLPGKDGRLSLAGEGFVWQTKNGELFNMNLEDGSIHNVASFPEFCLSFQCVDALASSQSGSPALVAVGRASSGKLYYATSDGSAAPAKLLSRDATSFIVASDFVMFTTTTHEVCLVPVASLISSAGDLVVEKRRVERGSRIVTVVPSTMSMVLQMPRGNLETINPRTLVMKVVRQDLDAGRYIKAFLACRKHRLDLSLIVEHDQAAFLNQIKDFVEQVDHVDHINLFLSSVGRGTLPPATIAAVCDGVRAELEMRDEPKYVNSIITAHVVKTPPDHEAGLGVLLRLKETNATLVEDALKYIIFLVDADRLFDTALGMYDFALVLMIAQHTRKDPREYLPFLRELRALEKHYQQFRIDDYLKRYEKALRNLSLAGDDRFLEAMEYVGLHQLYETALSIWKGTGKYPAVLDVYGDWLFERRDFSQAANVFVRAKQPLKAMEAYEKALNWQELFEVALTNGVSDEDVTAMGYRVAECLTWKRMPVEAARVFLDYCKNPKEAVVVLVRDNLISEARRIMTLHSLPELLTEAIYPAALENCGQLLEDIEELRQQLRERSSRIRELRIKRAVDPDSFYGAEDPNLGNVDVVTEASAFTRYTVLTKTSKRSSRSKRKLERKVGSGKRGTLDEEEYLLRSIEKLVVKFHTLRDETAKLVPHLVQFQPEHCEQATKLQHKLTQLYQEFDDVLNDLWAKEGGTNGGAEPIADGWARRMQEVVERARTFGPGAVMVPKPELKMAEWSLLAV